MKRNQTNQYSKPTTLTALLLILLLLFSGCADPSAMAGENVTTPAEATTTAPATTTGRPDGLEKLICTATLEDDFDDSKIIIMVSLSIIMCLILLQTLRKLTASELKNDL